MQRYFFTDFLKVAYWAFFITATLVVVYFYIRWQNYERIDVPMSHCDLRKGACVAELASGEKITLQIKPTNMPVLTSIVLEVKTQNIPVEKMHINFKGKEMNMGEFTYTLKPKHNGIYTVQTILPTCVQDKMIWEALLDIDTQCKHYRVPFQIINERPNKSVQSLSS